MRDRTPLLLVLLALLPTHAYAYIDPGTGSMIIQAILGAIAAAGALIGIFFSRIRAFFSSFSKRKSDKDE